MLSKHVRARRGGVLPKRDRTIGLIGRAPTAISRTSDSANTHPSPTPRLSVLHPKNSTRFRRTWPCPPDRSEFSPASLATFVSRKRSNRGARARSSRAIGKFANRSIWKASRRSTRRLLLGCARHGAVLGDTPGTPGNLQRAPHGLSRRPPLRDPRSGDSDMAFIKIRLTPELEEIRRRALKLDDTASPFLIHR
jgi:hypothetical protein